MHSISEKLKLIRERVFAKEVPDIGEGHCKEIVIFLRENINKLPDDSLLRIYGSNPFNAQYSAVFDRHNNLIFSPETNNDEVFNLPQVSFSFKDIKEV
jgi:hypothetical protein